MTEYLDTLIFLGHLFSGLIMCQTIMAASNNMQFMKSYPVLTINYTVLALFMMYFGVMAQSTLHIHKTSLVVFNVNPSSHLGFTRFYQCLFIGSVFALIRVQVLDVLFRKRHLVKVDLFLHVVDVYYKFKARYWAAIFYGFLIAMIFWFALAQNVPTEHIDIIREGFGIELNETAHLSLSLYNCSSENLLPILDSECSFNWFSHVFLLFIVSITVYNDLKIRIYLHGFSTLLRSNSDRFSVIHQHTLAQWKTTLEIQTFSMFAFINIPIYLTILSLLFNLQNNVTISYILWLWSFYPTVYNIIGLIFMIPNRQFIKKQFCSLRWGLRQAFYVIKDIFSPPPKAPNTGVFELDDIEYLYDSD
ncbi:unnamed protein product [Caenorhabditis angaria]|uniref:Uncharacterized protein n=1 Tax=Caenorhabditis angaria TaxID=860376 RepID=A0A9P1MZT0_9PELO|nr:unnamed protein product [Caenorhabditis angaria]